MHAVGVLKDVLLEECFSSHIIVIATALDLPAGTYVVRLIIRDSRTGLLGGLEFPLVLDRAGKEN